MSTATIDPTYVALMTQVMPRIIHTEEENENFTEILYNLTKKGDTMTPEEEDIADLLTMLIEDFEEKNYSMPERSTPLDMLEFFMDQHQMKPEDLYPCFASPEAAAEVLSGKRELQTQEIRKLSERFHTSPELFF